MTKNKKTILIICAILAFFFIVGTLTEDTNTTSSKTEANEQQSTNDEIVESDNSEEEEEQPIDEEEIKEDLELLEIDCEVDGYNRYIIGTIKNNTKNTYIYVQVSFNLYDKSGAQIGSTMDNINNLEPGGTWKFKALILEDDAVKFKLADITAF